MHPERQSFHRNPTAERLDSAHAMTPLERVELRPLAAWGTAGPAMGLCSTCTPSRALPAAKLTSEQVDAITDAIRQAARHGEHVAPDMLGGDLTWRMLAVAGLVVAAHQLRG